MGAAPGPPVVAAFRNLAGVDQQVGRRRAGALATGWVAATGDRARLRVLTMAGCLAALLCVAQCAWPRAAVAIARRSGPSSAPHLGWP